MQRQDCGGWFDLDGHQLGTVLRGVGIVGHDHRNRLTREPDAVTGEQRHGGGDELFPLQRRGESRVSEIGRGEHRADAGQRDGCRDVDAHDRPRGLRTADERQVQGMRVREVVGEAAAPGHHAGVLPAG